MDHGLFLDMVDVCIIAGKEGVEVRRLYAQQACVCVRARGGTNKKQAPDSLLTQRLFLHPFLMPHFTRHPSTAGPRAQVKPG